MKKAKSQPVTKTVIPRDFLQWWEPWGIDKATGASIGGHPDAHRVWARPEPEGGYTRRHYGISVKLAWGCETYRQEFHEWKQIGCPTRDDYVSLAATRERQKEFWLDLVPLVAMIGKDERSKEKIRQEFKINELIPRLLEKYKAAWALKH